MSFHVTFGLIWVSCTYNVAKVTYRYAMKWLLKLSPVHLLSFLLSATAWSAIAQMLIPGTAKTFGQYAKQAFIQYRILQRQLPGV